MLQKFAPRYLIIPFIFLVICPGLNTGCNNKSTQKKQHQAKESKNPKISAKKSLSAKASPNIKQDISQTKKPADAQNMAQAKKPAAVQNMAQAKKPAAVQNMAQAKKPAVLQNQDAQNNADENYEVYKEAAMDFAGESCDVACESRGWTVNTSKGILKISCYNYDCVNFGWSATGSDGQKLTCTCDGDEKCAVRASQCY